jgi:hypothetical protein
MLLPGLWVTPPLVYDVPPVPHFAVELSSTASAAL